MTDAKRQAIVVLGMHRSGTSGLTGCLHLLGCAAPRSQIPIATDNPKGFFESRPIVHHNDELLATLGLDWKDWRPVPTEFFSGEAVNLHDKGTNLIDEEFEQNPLFVLKDPRVCRLFPYWRRVLQDSGIDLMVVQSHRHPLEVAQSLQQRNKLPLAQGFLLWMVHVLQAERASRGWSRAFCSFTNLLENPVTTMMRIQEQLEFRFPRSPHQVEKKLESFLNPDQRHQRSTGAEPLPEIVQTIHEILNRWALSGEDPRDYMLLDRFHDATYDILSEKTDPVLVLETINWLKDARDETEATATDLVSTLQHRDKEDLTHLSEVLIQTIQRLNRQLGHADAQINQAVRAQRNFNAALADKDRIVREAELARDRLTARSNHLQKQLDTAFTSEEFHAMKARADRCDKTNETLRHRLEQAEQDREALRNSTIWRLTSPLRRLIEAAFGSRQAE